MSAIGPDLIIAELSSAVTGGPPAVLATVVATEGSVPRHTGTKMVVRSDGSILGTIGGGKVEIAIRDDALDALTHTTPALRSYTLHDPEAGDPGVCGGTMTVYLEPYMTPHTVYVIGAGHVGRAVVDLAHWLGFRTVVVDDRADQVTDEAQPNADIRVAGSVEDAIHQHPITADTSVVVVTRSHELDVRIAPIVLGTPAGYIGVMGSRRRWETTRKAIGESGLPTADLERIHNPIGIDIGAETVEEIAVSIMSEIITARRKAEE